MDDPIDRRHVVLTAGAEAHATQQDRLIVAADLFKGSPQVSGRVFVIPGEPLIVGAQHTRGRVEQSFAFRVIAGPLDQRSYGLRRFRSTGPLRIERLLESGGSLHG
jgi:hypothetical protein